MKPINDDHKSEIIDFIEQRVQSKSQTNEQMIRSLQLDLNNFKNTLESSLAINIDKSIEKSVNGKVNKSILLIQEQSKKMEDFHTKIYEEIESMKKKVINIEPILKRYDDMETIAKFFSSGAKVIITVGLVIGGVIVIFGAIKFFVAM